MTARYDDYAKLLTDYCKPDFTPQVVKDHHYRTRYIYIHTCNVMYVYVHFNNNIIYVITHTIIFF